MSVWKKIGDWFEDRTGLREGMRPLLGHAVPPNAKWWYVFGSATAVSFVIQVATGIALLSVYVPATGDAYPSLEYITSSAPWGRLLRGMHYFGASAMVLFVGLHLIRVYLTAAFKYPRELNWMTGALLLAFTLTMGFTGQLLRWDQNAVWSVVVGADQAARVPGLGRWLARLVLSGVTLGAHTLGHFFLYHVALIPGALVLVLGLHLYLVLRNGISEPPVAGQPVEPSKYRASYQGLLEKRGVPFWPFAAWRDVVFGTAVVAGIVLLAQLVGPPQLDKPPNPSIIAAQPRPDWYLLWYFAVLALMPHAVESYVIVLAPLLGGLILFAAPLISSRGERSWRRRPWAPVIVVFVCTSVGVLSLAGARARWAPDFHAEPVPSEYPQDPRAEEGRQVFNTHGCLFCHTISGHGGTRGPNLTHVGNRLVRDQITIRILNGGYNMPAFANILTGRQVDTVTHFLELHR